MAYADFDNDGDEDVVINNTNMTATLLKNEINDQAKGKVHFLNVELK